MNWLNNIKINVKLIGSYLVIASIIVIVATIGIVSIQNLSDIIKTNYNNHVISMENTYVANTNLFRIRSHLFDAALFSQNRERDISEINTYVVEVNNQISLLKPELINDDAKNELAEFQVSWSNYQDELKKVLDMINNGKEQEALEYIHSGSNFIKQRDNVAEHLGKLSNLNMEQVRLHQIESQNLFTQIVTLLTITGIIGLILSVVLGATISQSIIRPLGIGVKMMRDLSNGQLGTRLKMHRMDEIGVLSDAMDDFAETLMKITAQIQQSSASTTAATAEILAAVNQHTASANEQSASINQTVSTVDEVRAAAEQTAQKANSVAHEAQVTVTVSESGSQSVEAIISGMAEIREKVQAIAQDILALSEQTQQIGEITSTVDDIANQSNMLALNAAIEASKAGEQGKGFAVVAGEVRNLADQSKQATMKVRSILNDIQKATNAAVMATEQGTRGVESGVALAQQAGDVINQLSETIRQAAQTVQQISASAHQQNIGMEQISQAMKDINQTTIQFLAGARQSQTAAENLNKMAQDLQKMVDFYKT